MKRRRARFILSFILHIYGKHIGIVISRLFAPLTKRKENKGMFLREGKSKITFFDNI